MNHLIARGFSVIDLTLTISSDGVGGAELSGMNPRVTLCGICEDEWDNSGKTHNYYWHPAWNQVASCGRMDEMCPVCLVVLKLTEDLW